VDSEVILGQLGTAGYCLTQFPKEADVIIVNTCSFIEPARAESRRIIDEIGAWKTASQKLIICGCLSQLYGKELLDTYPHVDALVGSSDFHEMRSVVDRLLDDETGIIEISVPTFIYDSSFPRLLSTPQSYAYLKIAEGCSNHCSYCRIPDLRGAYRSREIGDMINEVRSLVDMGVKEVVIIAQDTTNFGADRKGYLLPSFLEALDGVNGLRWIRLLYTHPAHISDSLISVLSRSEKVCKYIDVPLQHTHPDVLRRMGRPDWESTRKLLDKLRERVPEIALRTTFLLGFPGEKESHFDKLLKDVEELEFDWMGAFTYSQEKGTRAAGFDDHVSDEVKEKRLKVLMELQHGITARKNQGRVGREVEVLVDAGNRGHTEFQSPESDGKTLFEDRLEPGQMFRGRVVRVVNGYDIEVKPSSHAVAGRQ
jgi:ribosomal protein S12 methylthiotransferase